MRKYHILCLATCKIFMISLHGKLHFRLTFFLFVLYFISTLLSPWFGSKAKLFHLEDEEKTEMVPETIFSCGSNSKEREGALQVTIREGRANNNRYLFIAL